MDDVSGLMQEDCEWVNNGVTAMLHRAIDNSWMKWTLSLDEMVDILHTTISNALRWTKIEELWFKFRWSLSLRVQLTKL